MDLLLFLRNGKEVARLAIAALIGFDNSGTSLVSDNVQDALVELSVRTSNFSFIKAQDGQQIIVPACQQMVLCEDEFCVEGEGEFCIVDDGSIALA